jgi:hypothetical protein
VFGNELKNYNFITKKFCFCFSSFDWILKVCCCVLMQRNLGKERKKLFLENNKQQKTAF